MILEQTIITVIGSALGSVLLFMGVRFTARQSAKVGKAAADSAARSVDVDEWRAILGELREEITRLKDRVGGLEAESRVRETRYRALLAYARHLLAWARDAVPDHTPPPVPEILSDELP